MISPMDEYEQKATPYGGRGLFATKGISAGTLILTCNEPYAWVIYKKFKKEVCAECFLYVRDDVAAQEMRRMAWKIRPSNANAIGEGVWFCSEKCRDDWGTIGCYSSEAAAIQRAIDRLHANMLGKQGKRSQAVEAVSRAVPTSNDLGNSERLDARWKTAESSLMKDVLSLESLSESELETARFLSSAIIRCWREEVNLNHTSGETTQNELPAPKFLSKWKNLLSLQDNEAVHLRAHPDTLDTWIRVYTFLRCAVQSASSAIPSTLAKYFETSERIRDVLARDYGNVFGIWEEGKAILDQNRDDESEMLGFAMYIDGSYFNHSCEPNVRKTRQGRAMEFRTTREIVAGEELNINYIDTKADWKSRRKELLDGWYFECQCQRCIDEQALDN